ncbi:MAG: hypothetical protein LBK95_06110, partial [Bifidobacteriaceae bacterium]|nr:hypothetical protein [Bifidobacteriaceae bacterium]
ANQTTGFRSLRRGQLSITPRVRICNSCTSYADHQLKTHHGWANDPATGTTIVTPPHSPTITTGPRE